MSENARKRGRPRKKSNTPSKKGGKRAKKGAKSPDAKGQTVKAAKKASWDVYSSERRAFLQEVIDFTSLGKGIALNGRSEKIIAHAIAQRMLSLEEPGGFRHGKKKREMFEEEAIKFVTRLVPVEERTVARIWHHAKKGEIYDSQAQMMEKRALMSDRFSKLPKQTWKFLESEVDKIIIELKGHASVVNILSRVVGKWGEIRLAAGVAHGVCMTFPFKKSTFHHFMTEILQFEYNKVNKIMNKLTPKRRRRLRRYLLELNRCLHLERAGTHIMVWMDETYCHKDHSSKYAWIARDGIEIQEGGQRIIIVQAMTRDGLLYYGEDDIRHFWSHDDILEQDTLSTELMWPAGSKEKEKATDGKYQEKAQPARGDYHLNMDGDMFILWVRHKLTPTFKKKYPDKKMILVLDNARYHHGRSDAYIAVNELSKYLMYPLLQRFGRHEIVINGKHCPLIQLQSPKVRYPRARVITTSMHDDGGGDDDAKTARLKASTNKLAWRRPDEPSSCNNEEENTVTVQLEGIHMRVDVPLNSCYSVKDRKPGENPLSIVQPDQYVKIKLLQTHEIKAKKEDLAKAVHDIIAQEMPDALRTNLEEWAQETESYLLFTPPYCPDCQPIELVWAIVKGRVGRDWVKGRTVRQTFDQLCNAFYGGTTSIGTTWKPISARLCNKLVERSLRMAQKRLQHDELLSGTIYDLDESKLPREEIEYFENRLAHFYDFEFGVDNQRGTQWSQNFLRTLESANSGHLNDDEVLFDDETTIINGEVVTIQTRHTVLTINSAP